MRTLLAFLLINSISRVLFSMPHATQLESLESGLTSLPLGKGLPVIVRAGLYFREISAYHEAEETFDATVDMRLRWEDPRLRYKAIDATKGFLDYRGEHSETKLTQIWYPMASFPNMKGESTFRSVSLRIFPTGVVELMVRITGRFIIKTDASAFPFDKQILGIQVSLREQIAKEASLVFLQEDVDFSLAEKNISLPGWTPETISIKRANTAGWYGETHSGLFFGLSVARQAKKMVAPIFIPLLASLLIPLLGIWMNHTKQGDFQLEPFMLANIIIGGLFAVIALNFTMNSRFGIIASGDNTLTRLFVLNYLSLGLGLCNVIVLYRFNLPKRLFGRYVQEQIFLCQNWVAPLISLGTALAFVLIAAA